MSCGTARCGDRQPYVSLLAGTGLQQPCLGGSLSPGPEALGQSQDPTSSPLPLKSMSLKCQDDAEGLKHQSLGLCLHGTVTHTVEKKQRCVHTYTAHTHTQSTHTEALVQADRADPDHTACRQG